MDVLLTTTTLVAAAEPNVTVAPAATVPGDRHRCTNPLPAPLFGLTLLTVGLTI